MTKIFTYVAATAVIVTSPAALLLSAGLALGVPSATIAQEYVDKAPGSETQVIMEGDGSILGMPGANSLAPATSNGTGRTTVDFGAGGSPQLYGGSSENTTITFGGGGGGANGMVLSPSMEIDNETD
jgi:hypothetical protein